MQPLSNNEEAKNMIIIKYYLAYLILLNVWPRLAAYIPNLNKIKNQTQTNMQKKSKRKLIDTFFSYLMFFLRIYSSFSWLEAPFGFFLHNFLYVLVCRLIQWRSWKAGKFDWQRHVNNSGNCLFVYIRRFYFLPNVNAVIASCSVAWFSSLKVTDKSIYFKWRILII